MVCVCVYIYYRSIYSYRAHNNKQLCIVLDSEEDTLNLALTQYIFSSLEHQNR